MSQENKDLSGSFSDLNESKPEEKVEEKFDKVRLPNYDPDNFKDYIFEQRID